MTVLSFWEKMSVGIHVLKFDWYVFALNVFCNWQHNDWFIKMCIVCLNWRHENESAIRARGELSTVKGFKIPIFVLRCESILFIEEVTHLVWESSFRQYFDSMDSVLFYLLDKNLLYWVFLLIYGIETRGNIWNK